MSREEIVSIVAHDLDKSFDHAFKQKIMLEVIAKRAILIKRDLDKGRIVNNSLVNIIKDIPLIEVEDPCGYYRTTCPIPKPIRLIEGDTLYAVGSSLTDTYDLVDPMLIDYIEYRKYNNCGCRGKYFYINGFIYANNDDPLTLQMIAGDPTQFSEFIEGCGNGTACNYDLEAFITMDMVDPIKRLIFETFPNQLSEDKEVKIND